MAIYHFSAKVIGRSSGSSAVAAAAYRSASELFDERLERHHDFSNKTGVTHSEVMLPEAAPKHLADRITLWNAVEAGEKRKDAQLAREIEFSIPREMTRDQGVSLACDFVKREFVDRGMIADLNVHWDKAEDGSPKPHAHVMLTMREIGPEGFGKKVVPWNDRALLQHWREAWGAHVNERLTELGIDARIDHRSYAEQGIALEPQHKIGPAASRRPEQGLGAERIADHVRIARENGEKIIADPNVALDAITRMQATFTNRDLAMFAFRHSDGKEQYDRVMAATKASPELVALGKDGRGDERFTSRDMIAIEARLERSADRLAGRAGHGLLATPWGKGGVARSDGLVLGGDQQAALHHIGHNRDLAIIVGYAGTGKSAMLRVARDEWEQAGYTVRGAALSGIAAENLEAGSGITSRTIASLEHAWGRDREQLGPRDVLVVDEAGMIGTRQMERLLSAADRAGAKVVLVGDPEQLQAIEAGAAFRALSERHGAAEITEIRRQRAVWQRDATRWLATGRTSDALQAYRDHDMVRSADTRSQARAVLVGKWDRQRQAEPDKSRIILTHTNTEVQLLNGEARERLRASGDLGQDVAVQADRGTRQFASGDRIMFLRNERELGVKNGTLGTVEQVSADRMGVRLDDGRQVGFDVKDYAAVDHGYAATIHKSQGVTVDRTHVLATPGMDRHAAYVALSRHRDGVQLHYGRDDFASDAKLAAVLSRDRAKDMAADYAVEPDAAARAFADRREIRLPERVREIVRTVETKAKSMFAGFRPKAPEAERRDSVFESTSRPVSERPASAAEQGQGEQVRAPRRGMFDGLKLDTTSARPAPVKAYDHGQDPAFVRTVERTSRAAEAVLQTKTSSGIVLEHQKVTLQRAIEALEQLRPGASDDMHEAKTRNPALLREAAAGRSGPMIAAMAQEARVRTDPRLRADRFVERWQELQGQHADFERAGYAAGRDKAGQEMADMAKGLERDPQVESLLRSRSRELGLGISERQDRDIGRELSRDLNRDRDLGMSR
ncbi:Ti-type conjugative transfer relaxase TraA [Sphingomonas sp. 10B4]|uniref:Ti-type conjugative transfer relaxase TraA n=1 Tax=Sphingomonas sp. 10B4 TaxID=3048575 RepID=UPI002AB42047|nr:Ti-type conjugative transfer relaxase TraA [Sphingomonas sp. 10B4]MDY7526313.1 Ti-type conjugative transfer relaxase TraA [Sphingomonas sp. 10B4]MEB0283931.1 Ti-type conjugative transfer relaxase TraA [Sphingomonas sp. 10B4]